MYTQSQWGHKVACCLRCCLLPALVGCLDVVGVLGGVWRNKERLSASLVKSVSQLQSPYMTLGLHYITFAPIPHGICKLFIVLVGQANCKMKPACAHARARTTFSHKVQQYDHILSVRRAHDICLIFTGFLVSKRPRGHEQTAAVRLVCTSKYIRKCPVTKSCDMLYGRDSARCPPG